jgi:hypothetical protein
MGDDPVPPAVRDALVAARRVVRTHLATVIGARAELAQALAILAGWALVTLAVARVARPDVTWPLSAGLLLLSLSGVKWLGNLFWNGLYHLTRDADG